MADQGNNYAEFGIMRNQPYCGSRGSMKTTNAQLAAFLQAHLRSLLEFRETADFSTYGFGIGGPYGSWLVDLQSKQAELTPDCGVSSRLKGVAAELLQVGMKYSAQRGRESEYTWQAGRDIQRVLEAKP